MRIHRAIQIDFGMFRGLRRYFKGGFHYVVISGWSINTTELYLYTLLQSCEQYTRLQYLHYIRSVWHLMKFVVKSLFFTIRLQRIHQDFILDTLTTLDTMSRWIQWTCYTMSETKYDTNTNTKRVYLSILYIQCICIRVSLTLINS